LDSPEKNELLFLHTENFFELIPSGKFVFDMALEDYSISSRIHSVGDQQRLDT